MPASQQIFLIAALLCFLSFLTLLSVASQQVRGVRELLLAAVLGMVCNVLYAFGRELPPLLAYEAANVTYAAASAALLAGYRALAGEHAHHLRLGVGVAAMGALIVLFHDVFDSFAARSVVVSLFQCAICVQVARTMTAARHDWQRPFFLPLFVAGMCVLVTAGHLGRIAWVLLAGPAATSLLQAGFWSSVFLTGLAVALPALALGGLLLAHRQILARAEHAGNHDFLTGAASRKAFFDIAAIETARAERQGHPLALVLVDMDHFKTINDRWGHQAGDAALLRLVAGARSVLRARDCVARLGGDEFALLLPDTDLGGASAAATRLQQAVRTGADTADAAARASMPTLTLSVAVTLCIPGESFKDAMARAAAALYKAKATGRDRVIVHGQPALTLVRRGP